MLEKELEVVLVVASGSLDKELELEKEQERLSKKYEKSYLQKPGLYVQREEEGPTLTFFPSGKFIVRAESKKSIYNETKQIFKEYDEDYNENNVVVSNMVGTLQLEENLKLNPLSITLGLENIGYYEPEQFPALSYKYEKNGVSCTFLAFSNGKIVVTGSRKKDEMEKASKEFIRKIKEKEQNFF